MALDKLVDSTQLDADLTSIANAIRTKGGTSSSLTFPTDFVDAIDAIETGGGGGITPAPERDVNFIDYDGTILYSYSASDFLALSELPANPTHDGLTAQGWNWSLTDAKTYVTSYGKLWVGQMYITSSGDTEIDVVMQKGRLSPTLNLAVNGTVTIDWGDNTALDTVTGTSLSTRIGTTHAYANPGNYTIKIHTATGNFVFYNASTGSGLFSDETGGTISYVYSSVVRAVRIGSGVTSLGNSAFYALYHLTSVTIPNTVTSIGSTPFFNCTFSGLVIPSEVTNIDGLFNGCTGLTHVAIPSGVTNVGMGSFRTCYGLTSVAIPSAITSIGNYSFQNDQSLSNITIPSGVWSIGNGAFQNCYSVAEYHLKPTTPPTLSNRNAFTGIASDCVMYVPYSADHSILNAYKTETNWSYYASYMQEEPQ